MSKIIPAQVEEAVGVPRLSFPLTGGCPFAKGELNDSNQVRLKMSEGKELPLQTTVLATWPDSSIKWLLLDTQVSLRAKHLLPLQIEYGEDVTPSEVFSPLRLTPFSSGLRIETGSLTVQLNRSGPALINQANDCLIRDGRWQMMVADEGGKSYTGQVEHLSVEEQNALRLVVKAQGGFVSDDGIRPLSCHPTLLFRPPTFC